MHRWSARHDDGRAANPADLLTIRCFETRLAGGGVPGLRTGMSVCWGGHSRREHRLHVLSGVNTGGYRQGPDRADVFAAGGAPTSIIDGQQPDLPEGLEDCASFSLRGFGRLTCRESIQV